MIKNKLTKLTAGLLFITCMCCPSCNHFLEMPEQAGINIDSVFSNWRNTELYLYTLYEHAPLILLANDNNFFNMGGASRVSLTDESGSYPGQSAYTTHKVYAGNVDATWFTSAKKGGEDGYDFHWQTIRRNWVMLENIDRVPDATPQQKNRIKGECRTLIALEYFEMWKRYGGMPLIKKALDGNDFGSGERKSVEETCDYIVQLCDEAINNPDFPARVESSIEFGRATKALAYCLKARTLLYAASDLFNTATPYMDFGEHNNLICFGNHDPNRWKAARDAAKEAIDYCESNGYAIVHDQGIDKNYSIAACAPPKDGNTEIVFATYLHPKRIEWCRLAYLFRGRANGYAANAPTQNAVEFYSNVDGTKVDWSKKITTPPNDPTYPYKNLDPRFHQSIAYNGCKWYTNPDMTLEFHDHALGSAWAGQESRQKRGSIHLYGFRKYFNGYEKTYGQNHVVMQPIFRLAEMYLAFAEASNEFGGDQTQAFDYIDVIRQRSGMPKADRSMDQEAFRDFIRDERAVELYAEDHRYFDLKRWKTPEKMLQINQINIVRQADRTFTYERKPYQTRAWHEWWYLHPFPYDEVNKNYGLVQNPGW